MKNSYILFLVVGILTQLTLVSFQNLEISPNRSGYNNLLHESDNIKIVTWNIRDLGRTKDANEISKIASILKDFDLVAIQEVVAKDPAGAKAVAKIADELNRMGSKWDYRVSDPTNSPSAYSSERYAFLWKTSKIQISGRPYLDKYLEQICTREPYIGKFKLKKSNGAFYVINVHSRKFDDHPEKEIKYFASYPKRLNSETILIVGDFNLSETHEVWKNLYQMGFNSAIRKTPTTLKTTCKSGGYLNHHIDNVFYSSNHFEHVNAQAIDFVKSCDSLVLARNLSDHLPVMLEFKIRP